MAHRLTGGFGYEHLTKSERDPVVQKPQVRYNWTPWTLQTYIAVSNTSPSQRVCESVRSIYLVHPMEFGEIHEKEFYLQTRTHAQRKKPRPTHPVFSCRDLTSDWPPCQHPSKSAEMDPTRTPHPGVPRASASAPRASTSAPPHNTTHGITFA